MLYDFRRDLQVVWLGYSLLVLGVLLAVAIGIAVSVGVIGKYHI